MFKERIKLIRQEKRLLKKLKSQIIYKYIIAIILLIFSLKKKFLVLHWKSYKKIIWMISFTNFYVLWKKIWYIDDFIVNKKLRWKWIWKRIFLWILNKLRKDKNNYIFLLSRKDRKASHGLYKKFWFHIISFGIWILAYKKLKKKNK